MVISTLTSILGIIYGEAERLTMPRWRGGSQRIEAEQPDRGCPMKASLPKDESQRLEVLHCYERFLSLPIHSYSRVHL